MVKMDKTLVSIIVPVYNVEDLLNRCIDSLLAQTHDRLEIILADDGSTDRSGLICDEYSNMDSRVRVLHIPNSGPSEARNIATESATGEYLMYVDSDDWVEADIVSRLLSLAQATDADISVCNLIRTSDENIHVEADSRQFTYSGSEAVKVMLYQREFDTGPCGKLYRTELIKKFKFPQGKIFEDLAIMSKVMHAANGVAYIPQQLYYYWDTPGSIMNSPYSAKKLDELDAIDGLVSFVNHSCPENMKAVLARKYSAYCQLIRWMPVDGLTDAEQAVSEKIWTFLKEYRWKMLLDNNARSKNRIAALLTIFGKRIFKKL